MLTARISAAAETAKLDRATIADRVDHRFNTFYTALVAISIGSYTLLAGLLHPRNRQSWSIHAVFAMHLVAAVLIVAILYYIPLALLRLLLGGADGELFRSASLGLFGLLTLWMVIYVTLAFRRTYGDGWWGAWAKAIVVVVVGSVVDNAVAMLSYDLAFMTI